MVQYSLPLLYTLFQSCGNTTRKDEVKTEESVPHTSSDNLVEPKNTHLLDTPHSQKLPRVLEFECESSGSCANLHKIRKLLEKDRTCQETTNEKEKLDCFSEVTMHFSDHKFNMSLARKEKILVTETSVDDLQSIAFRSRFQEYLSFKNGSIVKKDPAIIVPKNLREIIEIMNHEISISSYLFKGIPNQTLIDFAWDVSDVYAEYEIIKGTGHNAGILGALIENNPHHALVALDNFTLEGIFGRDILCSNSSENLLSQASKIKSDFEKILVEYGIGYINFSSGFNLDSIRKSYEQTCGQKDEHGIAESIENALALFFESMGNNPHIILVQAAASNWNLGNIDKDKIRYPNRIKIGSINMMYSDLDSQGVSMEISDFNTLYARYDGKGIHADVYVNLAFHLRANISPSTFMSPGPFGLGIYQASNVPSPSLAAPLGLSRIISLKETFFPNENLTSALIQKIFNLLTPKNCPYLSDQKCVFQDPSKHKELMIFKLGYR